MTWHVTRDMWQVGGPSLIIFRFLALTVLEWRCFEDNFTKDDWLNKWILNYKCVCRTALATPGLFIIFLEDNQFNFSQISFAVFSDSWKRWMYEQIEVKSGI